MRFLFFCYVQQKPGKDLTEEVRGLFLRVAQKLEISVLGALLLAPTLATPTAPHERANKSGARSPISTRSPVGSQPQA
jgi:hypothetical protein